MKKYLVEYKSISGKFRAIAVEAKNFDGACEAAVSATGCDFSDIQSVEAGG